MSISDSYVNTLKAAEILGIHPGTVKRLCREGTLRAEKIHNTWLIHKLDLHLFGRKYRRNRGRPPSVEHGLHRLS